MYTISIVMIVAGSLCYHVCNRSIDQRIAASISLSVTYAVALTIVAAVAIAQRWSARPTTPPFQHVGWATGGVAVGVVLIEAGYLLAYRAGGKITTASVFATAIASMLLLPAGVYLYDEHVSVRQLLGLAMAIVAIGLISQS